MKNVAFALLTIATVATVCTSCANLSDKQNKALIDATTTVLSDLKAGKTPKDTALDTLEAGLKDLRPDAKAVKPVAASAPATPAAP